MIFDLAPLCHNLLKESRKHSRFFAACIDESLKEKIQIFQMDFAFRYWDKSRNKVVIW